MNTSNTSKLSMAMVTLVSLIVLGNNPSVAQTVSTPIVGFSKVSAPSGTIVVVPSFVKANRFQGSVS